MEEVENHGLPEDPDDEKELLNLDSWGPRAWYDVKPAGKYLSHASWSRPVGS